MLEWDSDRNEAVHDLLVDAYFSKLSDLENRLQGHGDTEAGFYAGTLAAVEFLRGGAKTMIPKDSFADLLLDLENVVASQDSEPVAGKAGPADIVVTK